MPGHAAAAPPIDWPRYRRLGWFFAKVLLHILWWDLLLRQPILRHFRTERRRRWQRLARAYCTLATSMGGVPVKLGQFLSLRVDLLPATVTRELAVLQDQVPAAPLAAILAAIEADLQRPVAACFPWFAPAPLASASLGQVHRARLPSGEEVVVKVLRPGITSQIEMDLAAIGFLAQQLNRLRALREQIDLVALFTEFSMVTRRELDLVAEGKHAERFARNFADDTAVYIPKIYWPYSGGHTLTLENVGYLRIHDHTALAAAGIDPGKVATQLADLYLKQVFVHCFFHADPHPGNLFIKPLPHPAEARQTAFAPGEAPPHWPDRPFQIALVDFGMVAEIPAEAQRWLREFMIGLGLRDAHRIIQAYVTGNILRPGVDQERLEAMTADLLVSFPEALVGLMPDVDHPQTRHFWVEYKDLLAQPTFQIPINLLFMYRGLNIMGSLVRQLEPSFDLPAATVPFAIQLLWQNWQSEWQAWFEGLATLSRLLISSPQPVSQIWTQFQIVRNPPPPLRQLLTPATRQPSTPPPTPLAPQERQLLHQLTRSVERLTWVVLGVGCLLVLRQWQGVWPDRAQIQALTTHPDGWNLLLFLPPLLFFLRWLLLR